MPFGGVGAYWLLLGEELELRRLAFDLNDAAKRIRDSNYPKREEFAAESILSPKSEAEMIALFSKAELG